jgi:ElaB/YqjD/DUF883 family membrane-anchored ribosome-binding protein
MTEKFDLERIDTVLDEVRAYVDHGEAVHNQWALWALRAADELRAELVSVMADLDESEALRDRMAGLLTGVANALKGDPPPLVMHDWSDLPTVAKKAVTAAVERSQE